MGIGLYTSRLVLEALGIVDYGIYGIVGGIVTMFTFLNSSMSASTQRYLSFAIGTGDDIEVQKCFNTTLNIHLLIGVLLVVVAETAGLYLINYKLTIPASRIVAANWVFQFSIFTLFFQVIQVPYNALLIARESMHIYAYLSIVEVLLKLGAVFILINSETDRLILYSILTFSVSFIVRTIYKRYCKSKFKESVYNFFYDKKYYKEILTYSGWNMFGSVGYISQTQGSNLVLNIFFGPVANASYGIAMMVQGILGTFVSNFQIAVNPQIVQSYAKRDMDRYFKLIFQSTKFSFFLILILAVPFYLNAGYILKLWLKNIPDLAVQFTRIVIIYLLVETVANVLDYGAQACADIKRYKISIGIIMFLTAPISYLLFTFLPEPSLSFWLIAIVSFLNVLVRIFFLKKMVNIDLKFFRQFAVQVFIIGMTLYLFFLYGPNLQANTLSELVINSFITSLFTSLLIIFVGLNNSDRRYIGNLLFMLYYRNTGKKNL